MNLTRNEFIAAALAPFVLIALILGPVLLSGSTFGQRCAKIFPGDPYRAEVCTKNLSEGRYP